MDEKTVARFWAKVDKGGDGCWPWTAAVDKDGYGQFSIRHRQFKAHRLSWQIENGEIAVGRLICHRCDNPPCVNPRHLFQGTHTQNVNDMFLKGRANKARGVEHGGARINPDIVREIRRLASSGMNTHRISDAMSIKHGTVWAAANYVTWKHVA